MITKDGALICEYFYDAFGNCKVFNSNGEENQDSSFIGNINPFRWKSHYLDTETNLYYANGSYYDPSISEHVDAVRFSSIIDNAFIPFSLNPNGIMCNNILGYIPNTDNIETSQELSVNPAYDINANKPWWETMWASMLRWFYDLDIKIKIGIGLGLFLFACIITIATTIVSHGTATSLSLALGQLTLEFAIGVISSIAISTIIALAKDEPVKDAFVHGLADGIFFGGVFAFISSCVNLIKIVVRSYNVRQEELVKAYIKECANNADDAKQIYNSFEGKIKLKTSNGVKGHRYYYNIQAFAKGRYLTNKPTTNPIKDLVLYNNNATEHIVLEIAKGQKYLVGKIAGSPVKAVQFFVGKVEWLLP